MAGKTKRRTRVVKRKLVPTMVKRRVRNEKAVEGYMANPDWRGPDFCGNNGEPTAYLDDNDQWVASAGNHRMEAAVRTNRKIHVYFHVPVGMEAPVGSWW
ncbi:hypothetical protein K1T35_48510 (plasmid) [Pseudonocardia sp. DSM 110487]|uniref:hypothetical protein n=1 Tax=Pseudonocardia sp. DSM 110487 TaxID=2865833 RepID=UPI001C694E1A|nr:hypothetical protein [Pseudonocardia sp. DSM 110487]QYN41191.1 hypothetical protein K1T35_48510 [Pseudonocardia sp. DSM 110487]